MASPLCDNQDTPSVIQSAAPALNQVIHTEKNTQPSAVMASRRSAKDALDFFPTPPWATRALIEDVLRPRHMVSEWMTAWEPAAGQGHMAHVLEEYFTKVIGSDVHDYGRGFGLGSFVGDGADVLENQHADWIITNPPFNLALEFAERSIQSAHYGTALLVRAVWAEGGDRYRRLFQHQPPTHIAQFCDRVAMTKGHWNPQASTATAYAWFIWYDSTEEADTRFLWIPPGAKARHTKPGDAARFAGGPA